MAKKTVKNQNNKTAATTPASTNQPAKANLTQTKANNPVEKSFKLPLFYLLCIVLSIVAFIVYSSSLANGYVLDDVMVLKDNAYVKQGISAIPEIFSTPHMRGYLVIPNDLYRPFSLAVFAVEYQIWGPNPFMGHLFNVLTYVGCVLLFFLFLHRFFDEKKMILAFIIALLFAVHPIHTEVVANIKSRDELLCFLFAMLTLLSFMTFMKKGNYLFLIIGLFTLFVSELSKETVVATFLFILPLLFFFIKKGNLVRSVSIMAGSIIVTVIFRIIGYIVLSKYNANQPGIPVEFIDNALSGAPDAMLKLGTEILVMGYYLRMMFVPYPLISNYSYNKIPFVGLGDPLVLLTIVAYAALIFFAIKMFVKDKRNPWTFAILFYMASIALFSNFIFLMGAEVAERFTFYASAGTCILMGLAFDNWILKESGNDISVLKGLVPAGILALVCLPYFGLTFTRNFDWKSNATLYRVDLAKSPEDSRLNYYLGTAMAEGVYESETDTAKKRAIDMESIEHLRKSIAIYPDYTEANAEIGRVFYRENMLDSAEVHDKHTLKINPNHVTGNNNMGSVYLTRGRYRDAIDYFRKAATIDPSYQFAYFNMARAYNQLKIYDSAIINFKMTLYFNPANRDAEQELGMAYYNLQNWDSAAVHFGAALKLRPDDPNGFNNVGAIYLNTKKYNEAIPYFQKALSMNPNFINAGTNLVKAYYLTGQYPKAIETVFNDLKFAPKFYSDVPYIALCYQKMGKMDSAKKYEALARQIYSNFKLE